MSRFVTPTTFIVGATAVNLDGLRQYLEYTGQLDFIFELDKAMDAGVSPGEALCSFYAKLCYASLTAKRNKNLTKTRSIQANVIATLEAGHGSVFEHCWVNFVTTNCSRIFTHELIRHRVGTAFSQTSGRYVRPEVIDLVFDPILEPVREDMLDLLDRIEHAYRRMEVKMGLYENEADARKLVPILAACVSDFDTKKKITSALRRALPNGQANEMGWSLNLRAARHLIQLRTSAHAEWEIRRVFNDVYRALKHRYPLMFSDAKERDTKDGLVEVYGMKQQPYEITHEPNVPQP